MPQKYSGKEIARMTSAGTRQTYGNAKIEGTSYPTGKGQDTSIKGGGSSIPPSEPPQVKSIVPTPPNIVKARQKTYYDYVNNPFGDFTRQKNVTMDRFGQGMSIAPTISKPKEEKKTIIEKFSPTSYFGGSTKKEEPQEIAIGQGMSIAPSNQKSKFIQLVEAPYGKYTDVQRLQQAYTLTQRAEQQKEAQRLNNTIIGRTGIKAAKVVKSMQPRIKTLEETTPRINLAALTGGLGILTVASIPAIAKNPSLALLGYPIAMLGQSYATQQTRDILTNRKGQAYLESKEGQEVLGLTYASMLGQNVNAVVTKDEISQFNQVKKDIDTALYNQAIKNGLSEEEAKKFVTEHKQDSYEMTARDYYKNTKGIDEKTANELAFNLMHGKESKGIFKIPFTQKMINAKALAYENFMGLMPLVEKNKLRDKAIEILKQKGEKNPEEKVNLIMSEFKSRGVGEIYGLYPEVASNLLGGMSLIKNLKAQGNMAGMTKSELKLFMAKKMGLYSLMPGGLEGSTQYIMGEYTRERKPTIKGEVNAFTISALTSGAFGVGLGYLSFNKARQTALTGLGYVVDVPGEVSGDAATKIAMWFGGFKEQSLNLFNTGTSEQLFRFNKPFIVSPSNVPISNIQNTLIMQQNFYNSQQKAASQFNSIFKGGTMSKSQASNLPMSIDLGKSIRLASTPFTPVTTNQEKKLSPTVNDVLGISETSNTNTGEHITPPPPNIDNTITNVYNYTNQTETINTVPAQFQAITMPMTLTPIWRALPPIPILGGAGLGTGTGATYKGKKSVFINELSYSQQIFRSLTGDFNIFGFGLTKRRKGKKRRR